MSSEALSVFVDANILIYSEDSADPAKQKAAIDWLGVLWQRGVGRLSTQVLNEFYVIATRKIKPPMPAGDARAEVRRYELWQPWQIDHATVESAIEGMKIGAFDYLMKPSEIETLVAKVSEAAARKRQQEEKIIQARLKRITTQRA